MNCCIESRLLDVTLVHAEDKKIGAHKTITSETFTLPEKRTRKVQLIAGWLVKFVITTSLATASLKINVRKNM